MTILKKKNSTKKTEPVLDKENQERIDALKDAIQDAQKFKKIRGFILLVDASNDETQKDGCNGLRVHCGPMPVLANLYMNIDEGISRHAKVAKELGEIFNSDLDGILKKLKKVSENLE